MFASALTKMTAVTSAVLRGGEPSSMPSAELVCGDVLLRSDGDAVGADARLFRSSSLRVLEAWLTGESEAVFKDELTLSAPADLCDRATVVVGTVLQMSDIRGVSDVIPVLLLGVSLAVVAVPEGLPAILSLVLALGVQRMARHRATVKKLSSVETLGSATVIASDKTGTLTRAEMTIERVITVLGSTRITGVGYAPEGRVKHEGAELPPGALREEQAATLSGGSLAGNAERRKRRFERIGEVPFTSQSKLMSTLEMDHEHCACWRLPTG